MRTASISWIATAMLLIMSAILGLQLLSLNKETETNHMVASDYEQRIEALQAEQRK